MRTGRPAALDRRAVLRGGLAAVSLIAAGAAGCAAQEPVALSPDQVALDAAAQGEQALVALLAGGVADASPAQARAVEAATAAHRRHVAELVAAGASEPTATPSSTPATSSAPATAAAPGAVPSAAPTARVAVEAQEAQAQALTRSALGVSPDLAVLLGSVAASDAAHAWQLRSVA